MILRAYIPAELREPLVQGHLGAAADEEAASRRRGGRRGGVTVHRGRGGRAGRGIRRLTPRPWGRRSCRSCTRFFGVSSISVVCVYNSFWIRVGQEFDCQFASLIVKGIKRNIKEMIFLDFESRIIA